MHTIAKTPLDSLPAVHWNFLRKLGAQVDIHLIRCHAVQIVQILEHSELLLVHGI